MDKKEKIRIFMSYGQRDQVLAQALGNKLKAAGIPVWCDLFDIQVGDDLVERINVALQWCNTVLLLWSDAASNSRWVQLEWSNAIALDRAIIPCIIDNAELPPILANRVYVDFRDIDQGITKLLNALESVRQSASQH